MTPSERKKEMLALKKDIIRYCDRETKRLTAERAFLSSVLERSLGGLKKKSDEEGTEFVLADVRASMRVRK